VLRPILVGKDTKMHELMIFFGTLGGILMFGISGVLIGPLVASMFITIWELYGIAFSNYLPEVHYKKEQADEVQSLESSDYDEADEPDR
jgi:predicted PurR-regulated permease PerM